jgi:7,8-dihydroneopterin aldolase/epimerase/oxygenase
MNDEPQPTGPEDEEDLPDLDEDEGDEPSVTIEITGLSLYTRHGVSEAERDLGQRLVFDVVFELDGCDATVTDRVEDTVDYADVCQQVALAAQERSYRTLERLCSAVADRMIDRYAAESVTVRATKPEPPIPLPVEEVSVEVWRENR